MMNVQAGSRVGGLAETASSDRAEFRTDRRHRRRGPLRNSVRSGSILLKKSKIEPLRKSREGQFFVVSVTASLCRTGTRTYDRFCVNRCGPSHRPASDAPAVLKNFVRQPKKTFSTASVKLGSRTAQSPCPLSPR